MARNRIILYAVDRTNGQVISRVGGEVAWPVLDFDSIGQGGDGFEKGDYNGPMNYNLEKISVYAVRREWQNLRWTKKIPVEIKNQHRKFWGMKLLKAAQPSP